METNLPELKIDITASGTQLTLKGKNGRNQSKAVELAELVDVLAANVQHDLGMLPRGIRTYIQKGHKIIAAVEVPGGNKDIQYGSKTIAGCNMPSALFFFNLFKKNDGRLSIGDTYLFALRTQFVNLSTDPLYHYPAPNVYPETHRVCWGGALSGIDSIKSLSALTSIAQRYFAAPFNQDLFRASDLSNAFPWSELTKRDVPAVETYFKHISKNPFDNAWLRPALPRYTTFSKAIETFKSGES